MWRWCVPSARPSGGTRPVWRGGHDRAQRGHRQAQPARSGRVTTKWGPVMTVLRTMVRYVGWALSRIWLVIGLLVLWEVLTRSREDPFFPPPSEILAVLREIWFS